MVTQSFATCEFFMKFQAQKFWVIVTLTNKKDSILFARKSLNKAVEPFFIEA